MSNPRIIRLPRSVPPAAIAALCVTAATGLAALPGASAEAGKANAAAAKPTVTQTVTQTVTVTAPPQTVTVTEPAQTVTVTEAGTTITVTVVPTPTDPTTTVTTPPISLTTTPTTTTTTTTTTTSPPNGCAAKPDASNTGSSGTLTAYTGPSTIDTAGTVIENKTVNGQLTIHAPNVTVRNSTVTGGVFIQYGGSTGARLSYLTTPWVTSSSAGDLSIDHSNLGFTPAEDTMHITSDGGTHIVGLTITNNYIHDPRPAPGDHYDALQVRGADNSLVQCNNFALGPWSQPVNASVYFEDANGGYNNVRIDSNWLGGGGYALYLGHHGSGYSEVTNNTFGPNLGYGNCYDSADSNWLPTLQSGNVNPAGTSVDPVCVDR